MKKSQATLLDEKTILLAVAGKAALQHKNTLTFHSKEALPEIKEPLLCHARMTWQRLGLKARPCLDILELFLFVRPAQACAPTPRGLAKALDLPLPEDTLEANAKLLIQIARGLLRELKSKITREAQNIIPLAGVLSASNWPWSPYVDSLLHDMGHFPSDTPQRALAIWRNFPEWQESPPKGPAGSQELNPKEVRKHLADLIASAEQSELRPQQMDYTTAATQAFQPRDAEFCPHICLSEAGTGTGKTLGYLAPASLWSEKNQGTVWLSTFTRVLQGQLNRELDRLYPDYAAKDRHVAVRKGRENYACLLNFEEACQSLSLQGRDLQFLSLFARWLQASKAGELVGGDLPIWMGELFSHNHITDMADKRGECLFSACAHYKRCFSERSIRKAQRAKMVVANHALLLRMLAHTPSHGAPPHGAPSHEQGLPTRFVFDEGHHLFEAADSLFCAELTGRETSELRRWILGREDISGRTGRKRGLSARLEDLSLDNNQILSFTQRAIFATNALPGPGWYTRMREGKPMGETESFLHALGHQVYARAQNARDIYSIECPCHPLMQDVAKNAATLLEALNKLKKPLGELREALIALYSQDSENLDSDTRRRIDALLRSLEVRALAPLTAWIDMLAQLKDQSPEGIVDWFAIIRVQGKDHDLGYFRHLTDPSKPLINLLREKAHGVLITSATLGDSSGNVLDDWQVARMRSGTVHLEYEAQYTRHDSPFAYEKNARILIVDDVKKGDLNALAGAYRALFNASKGGALGLFTSAVRLKGVHERIMEPLENKGIPLFSQHVDAADVGALIEMFQSEPKACLLGTDAIRDGIDVPGDSLRLVVMERVPWPRPDIIHKARRTAFGGRQYDETLVRLRLKQAFGRLIRRNHDKGVFVILDSALPSRLTSAFPPKAPLIRLGLSEACAQLKNFFKN